MRRQLETIPRQRSAFLLTKCPDCGEERTVFSASTKDVGCNRCGRSLTKSTSGKAVVFATIVRKLG